MGNNNPLVETLRQLSENLDLCRQLDNTVNALRDQQPVVQRQVAQLTRTVETTEDELAFEAYDVQVAEAFMAYQSAVERLLEAQMHLARMHGAFNAAVAVQQKLVTRNE